MSKMKSAVLGIDGQEVGRRIRAALASRVLLVALTAYGREQDRRRLSPAGFDAHLLKAARYEDLTRILEDTAGGRSQHRSHPSRH